MTFRGGVGPSYFDQANEGDKGNIDLWHFYILRPLWSPQSSSSKFCVVDFAEGYPTRCRLHLEVLDDQALDSRSQL